MQFEATHVFRSYEIELLELHAHIGNPYVDTHDDDVPHPPFDEPQPRLIVQLAVMLSGDAYPGWQEHWNTEVGESWPVQSVLIPHWLMQEFAEIEIIIAS